jgi:hypothetical protein
MDSNKTNSSSIPDPDSIDDESFCNEELFDANNPSEEQTYGKKYFRKKSAVVYIQTVPPLFTVTRMREILSAYGEVGRIYLQVFIHLIQIYVLEFLCRQKNTLEKEKGGSAILRDGLSLSRREELKILLEC